MYATDEDCEYNLKNDSKNSKVKVVCFIFLWYLCVKYKKYLCNKQMGKVKESWLNDLTEEEIDLFYEELVLKGELIIYEPDENEEGNIQDSPEGEG